MKKILLLTVTLLGAFFSYLSSQTPDAPAGMKWEAVPELTDEFNGTELDSDKWDDYHPQWSGRPPSRFKKGNSFVQEGNLCLRSEMAKDPSTVNNPLNDYWVDAAACVSKGWTAKPGYYYEAKIKASNLSMTSSFWFRVGKYSEIDVIEHIGNPSRDNRDDDLPYEYAANTHYYGPHAGLDNLKGKWKMPTRGRDDFNVYGFWWKDPNNLWFYWNGQKIFEIKPRVPFEENLKLIFDTEVFPFAQAGVPSIGLPLPENLNDTTKNTMYVDWLRTYKLVEGDIVNESVSLNTVPTTLTSSNNYTFKVDYEANEARDVVVAIFDGASWKGAGTVTVGTGNGTTDVTVNLAEPLGVGDNYEVRAMIRDVGGDFNTNQDMDRVLGIRVEVITSLDINQLNDLVNVFPNPTTNSVTIEGIEEGVSWNLLNIQGEELRHGTESIIDLERMPAGSYYLEFSNGLKKKLTKLK